MSALPKLNATPKHEMVVPSTGKTVMFRPYLVKEEKVLLMAFETKDEKTAMQAMLDTIDACVEGEYVKSKLTTFDIEYMFTQIRGKSVGESIDVNLTCSECKKQTEMNINLADITVDVPEVDKGKLIIVTSKKIKYYAYEKESPQTVYEFNGNKIADKPLGTRIKNEKGKYKIQLFAS